MIRIPFQPRNALVAAILAASTAGCAQEQESLIIDRVLAWPSAEENSAECAADPGESFDSRSVLDVFWETQAVLPLSLRNQIAFQDPGSQNAMIDNSELQLVEMDIEFSMPQAPEVIDALRGVDPALIEFTEPLSSVSLQGGGSEQGIIVPAISQPAASALRQEIEARFPAGTNLTLVVDMVARASRTGYPGEVGIVESRSYSHPITLCSGCLTAFCPPACGPDDCSDRRFVGGVCGAAQDFRISPFVCP